MSDTAPIHATLVARYAQEGWRGALLRGPSGAGKSTAALALLARGWRLVADDRVLVWRSGGRVWGRAPDRLRGLLEVRGVGVMAVPSLDYAEIRSVIAGVRGGDDLERIPGSSAETLGGVALPLCRLDLLADAAAERVAAFCGALRL